MANQALLDIQAMLRKELERKSETMPAISGGDRVKLAGKVFSLPDGTSSEGPLGVIILDERYVNTYSGGGKPCKNGIRLAIIPADATADSSILMVDISPTGLKGYVTYMKALKAQGVLPIQVLTDLSFDPQASYPKLVFGNPRPHNLLEIAWPLREKAQKLLK